MEISLEHPSRGGKVLVRDNSKKGGLVPIHLSKGKSRYLRRAAGNPVSE